MLVLMCIGQAQGEETKGMKRGSQTGWGLSFQGCPALMPPGCIILCFPNKTLSCNPGSTFQIFVVARLNRGNDALSRQEDPLEKEMATHSSILAWRIPWTEEPGGL